MRSKTGVGIRPPKVPGAPKPTSSVMISNTLGAPFGGATRGGHHGVDSNAFSLITPPNFGSGGGSCFPSIVVVALGEPGVPVICWALAGAKTRTVRLNAEINSLQTVMVRLVFTCCPRVALAREDALPCAAV